MSNDRNTTRAAGILFEPLRLRNTVLRNRLIRSATYEGCGNADGAPRPELADLYISLAEGGIGAIVTGFTFVSQTGRAAQPGQCGIDTDRRTADWKRTVDRVRSRSSDVALFMQIAHTGRQTRREVTGQPAVGASTKRCSYFRQRVRALDDAGIRNVVQEFANAARRAQNAGFDGVQIHAAHGYLVHQFLSPWTNTRKDKWSDGPLFLEEIIRAVRAGTGDKFPVLVKLSWADDNRPGIDIANTTETVQRLKPLGVDAIELSYGSMEFALNIFRGACPVDVILAVNPLFSHVPAIARGVWKRLFLSRLLKSFLPFTMDYNVDAARQIARQTGVPIVPVGGIRSVDSMIACVEYGLPAVSLCRPLICEPDLPRKIRSGDTSGSRCCHCNLCVAYCDISRTLRCYRNVKGTTNDNF